MNIINDNFQFEYVEEHKAVNRRKTPKRAKQEEEEANEKFDIENDISSDTLREAVIGRIVERIVNGELSSLDIPWNLFNFSRRIRNAVNLKYRDDSPFTVNDTITFTFNFEED